MASMLLTSCDLLDALTSSEENNAADTATEGDGNEDGNGNGNGKGNGNKTNGKTPEGYTTFENFNVSFAYPSDWVTKDTAGSSRTATFVSPDNTAQLAMQSGPKTTMFEEMTLESFNRDYAPHMGGTVENVSVESKENGNGLTVKLISFSATNETMTAWQIWYAVTIDETTHVLMLTVENEDEELFENIFNSIKATDGENYSSESSSSGNTNVTNKPSEDTPSSSTPPKDENETTYQDALRLLENKEYENAYVKFMEIPDYKNVADYLACYSWSGDELIYDESNFGAKN